MREAKIKFQKKHGAERYLLSFSVSYTFPWKEIKFGELKLVIVHLIAVNLCRSSRNVPIIVCLLTS